MLRVKVKYTVSGLFILLVNHLGWCQADYNAYEKAAYMSEGDTLLYRILYPADFDESKEYPVILMLHGSGERGNNNEAQLVHGGKLFLSESFRKQFPAVVIFPQCPADDFWSRVEVDRSERPMRFQYQYDQPPTTALKLVMDLMDSVQSLPYSRDEQFYVGGLSMGGMGTFEILYRRPEMFAAAFPICGGGNPDSVDEYAGDVDVWVFHGAQDDIVLPSYSTEMVIALMKADADVKYTLYKDANHNSWDSAFAEPDLFPWLFTKRKNK